MTDLKTQRKISKAGRAAMGEAGRQNLATAREKRASERLDVGAEAQVWANDLLAELGPNPSAKQRALVKAAQATYGCILLVINKLQKARVTDSGHLLERTSFLSGNLDRLLKRLELPPKPRPRTILDLNVRQPAPNGQISTPKPTIQGDSPHV